MSDKRLKMMALDAEDLSVVSAHCQDAVMKLADLQYLPAEKRFVIELNRFAWEQGSERRERRRSVLHFDRVASVRAQGIDQRKRDQVLSLLAIVFEEEGEPSGHVNLVFAGNGQIRLAVECIEAQLTDLKASWEAASTPRHDD